MLIKNGVWWQGDCLEVMERIPDGSVDMILCDLPYGTIDGISKSYWHGMGGISWDKVIPFEPLFETYSRILRESGACVLFSQEPFTHEMLSNQHPNIPFSYRMYWLKNHHANALFAKKAPLKYVEEINVFKKKYDTQNKNPLRVYAKKVLNFLKLNQNQISKELGHERLDHFFRVNSTQFKPPSQKAYEELISKFNIDRMPECLTYDEIEKANRRYCPTFNIENTAKFKKDVLEFPKDRVRLHPTQKPVALFEYLIKTYTNDGDVVLDNCAGSGTTAIACENTGRHWVCIEQDAEYSRLACERIRGHVA